MAITKQQALKKLRENQGLSLREMAKKCGVDKSTISKLERGLIHSLTEETERKLAIGYGIITRVIRRDPSYPEFRIILTIPKKILCRNLH
jgi:transcriptional regulator with XRE-family HTH domain